MSITPQQAVDLAFRDAEIQYPGSIQPCTVSRNNAAIASGVGYDLVFGVQQAGGVVVQQPDYNQTQFLCKDFENEPRERDEFTWGQGASVKRYSITGSKQYMSITNAYVLDVTRLEE